MQLTVEMNAQMMNGFQTLFKEMGSNLVRACAEKYGFNAEEAIQEFSVNVGVKKTIPSKRGGSRKKSAKADEPKIPMPFSNTIKENCCQGIKQNHGLYTQCMNEKNTGDFCKQCEKQSLKNSSGEPDFGVISKRSMTDFKDPKGRSPTPYMRVLEKLKVTKEEAIEEAGKFNIVIDPIHFEVVERKRGGRPKTEKATDDASSSNEEKKKGRPKKALKEVVVDTTEDLFASLVQECNTSAAAEVVDNDDVSSVSENDSSENNTESESKKSKKKNLSEEDKQALAFEKEVKKQALEAKKKALEEEKEAKKQALQKEKEAKKKALEEEKEAKKKALEEEKEAKKEAKKAKEGEKKTKKPAKVEEKVETKVEAELEAEIEAELEAEQQQEEEAISVKKWEFKGKTYLKSSANVVYDVETQDELGVWSEEKQDIIFSDLELEEEEVEDEQ